VATTEEMSRVECVELLERASVGRLTVSHGALPMVLPTSFRLSDSDIIFDAAPAREIGLSFAETVVGFQADDFDDERPEGRSVMVVGMCHRLEGDDEPSSGGPDRELTAGYELPKRIEIGLVRGFRL
jgi:nitroimidazol reductase NimA-like FMN-containing flavoprotein (pyridoxamine 5'-phosphate oxidase superfamily)